jgi:CBS domain-containing protein
MLRVDDILSIVSKRLVVIQITRPVVEAARLLSEKNASLIVVCSAEGLMQGVVTKSDVVKQISRCQGCGCTAVVSEVMTRQVISCRPDQSMHDVWRLMKDKRLKQMPVVDQSAMPLGLLYADEALEVLMKEVENEEELYQCRIRCRWSAV